eukprot:jgi/Ulvmu1/1079/UM105_0038.1
MSPSVCDALRGKNCRVARSHSQMPSSQHHLNASPHTQADPSLTQCKSTAASEFAVETLLPRVAGRQAQPLSAPLVTLMLWLLQRYAPESFINGHLTNAIHLEHLIRAAI